MAAFPALRLLLYHRAMIARRPPVPPPLALLFGLVAVSSGAIFFRLADAPPLVESAYRTGLATLVLLPIAWTRARHELRRLTRRDLALALGAGAFLALHFAAWVSSLDLTTVAASTVLVTTNPIWVGLLTPFLSTDRITRQTALGIAISVVGAVVIGWGDFQGGTRALLGDALAVVGAIAAAFYLLIGRRLRQRLSLVSYIVVCYGMAAVLLLGVALLLGQPLLGYSPQSYAALLAVALIPQVLGHSSFNWALEWFSASLIAVVLLGEPILSTLWAYLFLGEAVAPATLWGGALILVGVFFAARGERRG